MTCPHGEIDPSCCLDCLDAPPPERPRAVEHRASGYVVAQFEGHCPGCDEAVEVGDKIVEHRPGRWGHLWCVS